MIERPILFSGEMVRAILDGRKTETRRILNQQPLDILPMKGKNLGKSWVTLETKEPEPHGRFVKCRFGVPGDQLWVRETWKTSAVYDPYAPRQIDAAASVLWVADKAKRLNGPEEWGKTRTSIHMTRWASRITLEIKSIHAERLQSITEKSAIAEGVQAAGSRRAAFECLWDDLNGDKFGYGWNANPFVWVISFKVICTAPEPRP